jgi:hypothetical protein
MSNDVSIIRLAMMRFVYLGNLVFLGFKVWPELITHQGSWDAVRGAALSFWAALSLLSALGLRYPLQMLPLLLLQLLYKVIWLTMVWLPLRSAGESTDLTNVMLAGVIVDLVVIPWAYVSSHYLKQPGTRWR